MTYSYTLPEDVLDILFANRNKEYGAYLLRRGYPHRLQKSIGLMLGGMALLSASFLWRERRALARDFPIMDTTSVILQPAPAPPIQHPRLAPARAAALPRPTAAPPVPTLPYTPPLLVDKPDLTRLPPAPSALDQVQVGTSTVRGDPSATGIAPGVGATAGSGTGTGDEGPLDINVVERLPEFPGGEAALRKFFERNLQYPDEAESGEQVKVVIRFVVGKDGSLNAYAVDKSGGRVFDAEVIRVLQKMPKWIPGLQNGRPVAVYFNLPVTFMRSLCFISPIVKSPMSSLAVRCPETRRTALMFP